MDFIVVPTGVQFANAKSEGRVVIPVNSIHCIIIHDDDDSVEIELSSHGIGDSHLQKMFVDKERMTSEQFLDLLRMVGGKEGNAH